MNLNLDIEMRDGFIGVNGSSFIIGSTIHSFIHQPSASGTSPVVCRKTTPPSAAATAATYQDKITGCSLLPHH
jgi:hypothetical protein